MIATTPQPPYYAVIFTSILEDGHSDYAKTADLMISLAKEVDGFLGVESARDQIGITVSYWRDLKSIQKWREHSEHQMAKKMGKEKWYKSYALRITRVETNRFFQIDKNQI